MIFFTFGGVSSLSCWNPDDLHPVHSCPGKLNYLLVPERTTFPSLYLCDCSFSSPSHKDSQVGRVSCGHQLAQDLQPSPYIFAKWLSSLCLNISGGGNSLPFKVSVFIHSLNSFSEPFCWVLCAKCCVCSHHSRGSKQWGDECVDKQFYITCHVTLGIFRMLWEHGHVITQFCLVQSDKSSLVRQCISWVLEDR